MCIIGTIMNTNTKKILIILSVITISLSACGKENPVINFFADLGNFFTDSFQCVGDIIGGFTTENACRDVGGGYDNDDPIVYIEEDFEQYFKMYRDKFEDKWVKHISINFDDDGKHGISKTSDNDVEGIVNNSIGLCSIKVIPPSFTINRIDFKYRLRNDITIDRYWWNQPHRKEFEKEWLVLHELAHCADPVTSGAFSVEGRPHENGMGFCEKDGRVSDFFPISILSPMISRVYLSEELFNRTKENLFHPSYGGKVANKRRTELMIKETSYVEAANAFCNMKYQNSVFKRALLSNADDIHEESWFVSTGFESIEAANIAYNKSRDLYINSNEDNINIITPDSFFDGDFTGKGLFNVTRISPPVITQIIQKYAIKYPSGSKINITNSSKNLSMDGLNFLSIYNVSSSANFSKTFFDATYQSDFGSSFDSLSDNVFLDSYNITNIGYKYSYNHSNITCIPTENMNYILESKIIGENLKPEIDIMYQFDNNSNTGVEPYTLKLSIKSTSKNTNIEHNVISTFSDNLEYYAIFPGSFEARHDGNETTREFDVLRYVIGQCHFDLPFLGPDGKMPEYSVMWYNATHDDYDQNRALYQDFLLELAVNKTLSQAYSLDEF